MEALGATASVLQVVDLALRATSALIEYTNNTRNASKDRKMLAEETKSLAGLLERLRTRAEKSRSDDPWLEERMDLVRQFSRANDDLAGILKIDATIGQAKSESRIKTVHTMAKWSFTKSEVFSVLERITRLQLYANTLLLDEQCSLIERIDNRQQDAQAQKQRLAILGWLTPLQVNNTHESISKRPEEGSGRWFLTSSSFRTWQSGQQKLLWCPGIPGAGKTVMSCIVVDYLLRQRTKQEKANREVGIVMMYLKYNDPQQTLESILGSFVAQLIQDCDTLPVFMQDLYERYKAQNTAPSLSHLMKAFQTAAGLYKRVFVVLDALDECSDEIRWELMESLRELEPQIHLLVTSRFLDSIEEELQDFQRFEIKANKADLELFIDHHIRKNRNLQRIVQKSPAMSEDIKVAVVKTAEDMFLLARLHVESLSSAAALSIKYVRKKLQSLPTTLIGTYDEAMQRIEAQESDHRNIAFKTLAWVSYAFRPLSVGELQHALAIEPGSAQLDEEDILDGNSITALCAGLVIVDQGTNVVTLVHYTTKNYFENIRENRFPGFHATITMSCATYLALSALKDASIWTIVRQYPLACYAAQYMGDHARQNPEEALEPSVLELIGRLLSHPAKRKPLLSLLDGLDLIRSGFYSTMVPENVQENGPSPSDSTMTECSPRAPQDEAHLGQDGGETDNIDSASIGEYSTFSTADTAVCISDINADLSTVTLEQGMDADLSTATLEQGMDADSGPWQSPINMGRMPEVTALHLAASMGLAKVASLLIKESGDIDAVDDSGKTALALAMERGFQKAVEFLVNSGAKVDLRTEHGQSIFLLVTERDWDSVAAIISRKNRSGTLSDLESDLGKASAKLLLAAYDGDVEVIEMLMKRRDILKIEDQGSGAIALFIAVERKHLAVAQLLLGSGVNVDAKDSMGQTSLHRATHRENEGMIRLLLKNGADIDCQNDDGRTSWSANVRTTDERILKILLEAGADPSTKGHQGVSELYIASQNGETQVVKLMLDSGTDPSVQTQFLWAPLHWAAYYGHLECVKMLIRAGADLSPVSDQDASPLDLALRANQIEIVDILSRAGAKESRDIQAPPKVAGKESDSSTNAPRGERVSSVSSKIALTFDKPIQQGMLVGQFIYPSTLLNEKGWVYQVSHPLETLSSSVSVKLAQRRADMVEYPLGPELYDSSDILYDIRRITLDYQQLELRGGTQSALSGVVNMHKDWTGGWKVRHNHDGESDYLFRTTPDWSRLKEEGCRWRTEDGKLLARTSMVDVTPVLCFEHGLERKMQDIIVCCWVGKLWSEAVALQRREREKAPHP